MAILIAIFAGELVWRERDVRISDMANMAPIPNGVAFLGQFLALVAMLVTLQLVLMAAGIALQSLRGYYRYEISVYLQLLFGVKLVDYILFAALAMAVHVVVNHKYVGHLIVVLYLLSTIFANLVGIENRMLVYGSDPGWIWSDLSRLAPFVEGLVFFKLYWAAWALLLAVVASVFWVRGRETGIRARVTLAMQRLQGSAMRSAALGIVLVIGLGGFVFYNTNVLNRNRSDDEIFADRAEYERRYKQYENAPEPSVVAVSSRVELYPAERSATVSTTYQLVNRTERSIDTLHVATSGDVETVDLTFGRDVRLALIDSLRQHRIYVLAQPLAVGDTMSMSFEVAHRPRGFRNAGAPTDVTPNGAYVNASWMPTLGYQPNREVMDERARRERGLPPRPQPPGGGDIETQSGANDVQFVDVETIIGTDPKQIAVTPGTLVREWNENGRRYFHYRTDTPIRYASAVLSAVYAVREDRWNDVQLRIYHHPTHDVNVERMMHSMKASLAYFTQQFGPYQYRELRIVEFPRYQSFARAHPHTIAFSEGGAFLTRVDSGMVDRPFFVVAHETAHQWWGGQVIPAQAAGAALVSETLAQYSSMMVLETTYGQQMARDFYDYHMQEYFRGRSVFTNRETPLLDVVNQGYLHYFKGGLVMYTLRERLGADSVNAALRRFLTKYSGSSAPPATSHALYAELRQVTPDSLRPLLSDLFEHITLWDVRADSVRAEPSGHGEYTVTLFVDASKARADSVGRKMPVEMDDLIEVGVFAGAPGERVPGQQLYLAQHRIRSGKQAVVMKVRGIPTRAGIDPFRRMIEQEHGDNVVEVTGRQ